MINKIPNKRVRTKINSFFIPEQAKLDSHYDKFQQFYNTSAFYVNMMNRMFKTFVCISEEGNHKVPNVVLTRVRNISKNEWNHNLFVLNGESAVAAINDLGYTVSNTEDINFNFDATINLTKMLLSKSKKRYIRSEKATFRETAKLFYEFFDQIQDGRVNWR